MLTNKSIESTGCLPNEGHSTEICCHWQSAPPSTERNVDFIHKTEQATTHCLLNFLGFSHGKPGLAASKILEIIAKSFGAPIAMLWVPDSRAVALRCQQFWTEDNPISAELVEELSQIELWPVEALPGRVWAQGRGEIVHEVASDRHPGRATLFPKSGIRSAFAIPARVRSETLCVLELLSREPFAFQSVSALQMNTLSDALGILFRPAPLTNC
jgi:hypothetical protein